ncbi:efflux RND transporter periplasmic adaptor subunit [Streptomyces sp. NPDC048419]|uniref:efflux RND transporter periplasmic adaptor subunit n=1 Tax=Streptomyces sp. NPDC048419 TaxID=3365547 RepID=UPI003711F5F6
MSELLARTWVRWTALGLAIAAGVVAALLTSIGHHSRLLFTVRPTDVSVTQALPASLTPSGQYYLFFGRTLSMGEDGPALGNPCEWFPGQADPATSIGPVSTLSATPGQHVMKDAVLAEANSDQAKRALEEADKALTDARSALAADQKAAEEIAGTPTALGTSDQPAPGSGLSRFDVNTELIGSMKRVTDAEKQRDAAQRTLDSGTIKAPVHGIIDSVNTAVGSTPSCRIPVLTMHSDTLSVTAHVPNSLLSRITPGQPAEVKVSDTGDSTKAAVETTPSRVLTTAEAEGDAKNADTQQRSESRPPSPAAGGQNKTEYPLIIPLASPPASFRPGMAATLILTLDKHSGVLAVPSKAIKQTPEGPTVTVVQCEKKQGKCRDAKKTTLRVRTGLTGNGMTEIVSGLRPGAEVMVPKQDN